MEQRYSNDRWLMFRWRTVILQKWEFGTHFSWFLSFSESISYLHLISSDNEKADFIIKIKTGICTSIRWVRNWCWQSAVPWYGQTIEKILLRLLSIKRRNDLCLFNGNLFSHLRFSQFIYSISFPCPTIANWNLIASSDTMTRHILMFTINDFYYVSLFFCSFVTMQQQKCRFYTINYLHIQHIGWF